MSDNEYDVSILLAPTDVATSLHYDVAKRWAEASYLAGQRSRDEDIDRIRKAYLSALATAKDYEERINEVLEAYARISKRIETDTRPVADRVQMAKRTPRAPKKEKP